MASSGSSGAGATSLEQLIALNNEMAALIRAGIPLERGLAALGGQLPGRPSRLAEWLASRMSRGESLPQILADEDDRFPPVWRAVVQAGLRSGQPAAALQSLSETARRVSELRKLVAAGLLYPLMVVAVAYLVFLFLVVVLAPMVMAAHADLTGVGDPVLLGLAWLGRSALFWAVPVPLVAGILAAAWWRRSGWILWSRGNRAVATRRGAGIRQTLHNGRMATFAEILALLVHSGVPLDQAVVLAAEASGDRRIADASGQIAERIRRGEAVVKRGDLPENFPPLLGWLLLTGGRQPDLGGSLLRTAAVYRERSARTAAWTAVYLPISMTILLGGTATLLCGLAAFVPIVRMLYHLTWPAA
ncbi:MAG: type II secretion system F family protein [Pirellulales bacterium]|nr:type II secretion system F family protein [Pirellulales bacterium]